MKRTKIFFVFLIGILLTAFSVQAQTQVEMNEFNGSALLIHFPSTNVDSTESIYSDHFTLAGYDARQNYISLADTGGTNNLVTTYTPIPIYFQYILSSALAKPKITGILQGSNDPSVDGNWATAGTITATADSIETLQTAVITITVPRAFYRFKWTGTAGNRIDTYVKADAYLPTKKR